MNNQKEPQEDVRGKKDNLILEKNDSNEDLEQLINSFYEVDCEDEFDVIRSTN